MRLIDAEAFEAFIRRNCADSLVDLWCELVRRQPTVYDVDKVVKKIEEIAIPVLDDDEHIVPESNIHETCELEMVSLSNAIEIVRRGGICR